MTVINRRSPASGRPANGRLRRILLIAVRSGEGPLTEHITATQAQPPERVFMPHTCRSRYSSGSAQLGGFLRFQIWAAFDTHGLKAVI
jgi:hypothetical protein